MIGSIEEAEKIVIKNLPKGTVVKGGVDYQNHYLFIAHRPDPLEGYLDPFFSVEKSSGYFRDFSPMDYDEPLEVINALKSSIRERSERHG